MVQYVLTPWRHRDELLLVRQQLYPDQTTDINPGPQPAQQQQQQQQQQRLAVARVAMWMQRGNCPHLIESTALLTAAMLSDSDNEGTETTTTTTGLAHYASRATYAAAFSRFVTGLLDSHQDRTHKLSMHAVAKTIGLPATFVELRHQATHEQLPSLARLRAAAGHARRWMWTYYWVHLGSASASSSSSSSSPTKPVAVDGAGCEAAVRCSLHAPDPAALVRAWGEPAVVAALERVVEGGGDDGVTVAALRLWRRVLAGEGSSAAAAAVPAVTAEPVFELAAIRDELEQVRAQLLSCRSAAAARANPGQQPSEDDDDDEGWSEVDAAAWVAKPIGVV